MITISDDDLVQNPIIRRGSWMETVNEIHGVYPQRILTAPVSLFPLWGTGDNDTGALGLGDLVERFELTEISTDSFYRIGCGAEHTMTIKWDDGTLWGTGSNEYYSLGINDGINKVELTQVGSDTWLSVDGGFYFTLAIKTDNTLWATGYSSTGQLGLGEPASEHHVQTFTQVGSDTWSSVACGAQHTMAIKSDSTLWATGINTFGQLGLNDTDTRYDFTQVGSDTWSSVSCGEDHSMAIKSDGTLWSVGRNWQGQLGIGAGPNVSVLTQVGSDTWSSVSCGGQQTMAIKSDGTLWGTGDNLFGQLGLGDTTDRNVLTQVGLATWLKVDSSHRRCVAIKNGGTMWVTGTSTEGGHGLGEDVVSLDEMTKVGTDKWSDVACGSELTILIKGS